MAAEKNFENKIKQFLQEQGAYFIKYWGGGQFTKAGVPDILACINGYFVGIEVKAQNGRPSKLQIYHCEKIREAGGFAFIVYPSGWKAFSTVLTNLDKLTPDIPLIVK